MIPPRTLTIVGRGRDFERAKEKALVPGRRTWCTSSTWDLLDHIGVKVHGVWQLHQPHTHEHFLSALGSAVILMRPALALPKAKILPHVKLRYRFGDRFGSTLAWMLALAVDQKYQEIDIHGVHLTEPEWVNQRETFFWFCGYCEAKGITVNIRKDSGVFIENQTYEL